MEPVKHVRTLNFPTDHDLNLSGSNAELLRQADLVLTLEVDDIYGTLHHEGGYNPAGACLIESGTKIISIGTKDLQRNSLVQGYMRFQPVFLGLNASVEQALPDLVEGCRTVLRDTHVVEWRRERRRFLAEKKCDIRDKWLVKATRDGEGSEITRALLALEAWQVLKNEDFVIANGSLKGWVQRLWDLRQPKQWLGSSGGAGLGYGLGASLGAALAYRDKETIIIDFQADGDFLFTPSALWTAAHYNLPVLIIMDNNRGYYNSYNHQSSVANRRDRDHTNAATGTLITDPSVDFVALARSFGIYAEGPVSDPKELSSALNRVTNFVKIQRRPALLEVLTIDG